MIFLFKTGDFQVPCVFFGGVLLMVQKSCYHQVGSLSHYLRSVFIHPRWLFGISAINSINLWHVFQKCFGQVGKLFFFKNFCPLKQNGVDTVGFFPKKWLGCIQFLVLVVWPPLVILGHFVYTSWKEMYIFLKNWRKLRSMISIYPACIYYNLLYVGSSPLPRIPVTTRIIVFLGPGIPN